MYSRFLTSEQCESYFFYFTYNYKLCMAKEFLIYEQQRYQASGVKFEPNTELRYEKYF